MFAISGDERVADFMIGDALLFVFVQPAASALRTSDDFLDSVLQVALGDGVRLATRSQYGRFIEHIGKVRAGHSGGGRGQTTKVDIGRKLFPARVDLENRFATIEVGRIDHDLAIESTGTQKGAVEDFRSIGSREHDHPGIRLEPVHLHQQGIEGLFPFVVDSPDVNPTLPADRIQLVNENDAWGVLLGLLEEIAHARGADSYEHLHEIGPAQREERHAGFASNRPGKQRLSGAGRADQQSPLRYFCAKALVVFRILKKVDNFLQFLLGFIAAGDIGEGHAGVFINDEFCAALPDAKNPLAGRSKAPCEQRPQTKQDQDRKHPSHQEL